MKELAIIATKGNFELYHILYSTFQTENLQPILRKIRTAVRL